MDTSPRHLTVVEPASAVPVTLFGPVGLMDEDGFSGSFSYAEKATIERQHLAAIGEWIGAARAADQYNMVIMAEAYCDDVRARIENFDAVAARPAVPANDSHALALKAA